LGTIVVFLIVLVYSFLLVRVVVDTEFPFNEFVPLMIFVTMMGFSFYMGISLFAEEKNQAAFEYLLSLNFTRAGLLRNKLLPRIAALAAFFVLYAVLSQVMGHFTVPGGWLIFTTVYVSLFLASASMSLMHRNHITTMVYALAIFMIVYAGFAFFMLQIRELDVWGPTGVKIIAVCIFFMALIAFTGFCFHFRRMDLGNMNRLFRWSVLGGLKYIGLSLLVLTVLWIVINRFDAADPAPDWTIPAQSEPRADNGNGFFRLWTLSENPDLDVERDQQIILKYRRLFDPQFRDDQFTEHWDYWAQKKTYSRYIKRRTNILRGHTKLLIAWTPNDWLEDIIHGREAIFRLRDESAVYLERYSKIIACERFEDLTLPRFDSPLPNLLAWIHVSELYNWLAVLEAREGGWDKAAKDLLRHADFLKRAVGGSRVLLVNLVAKSILRNTLVSLAQVMNLEDCPQTVARSILKGVPAVTIAEMGSETVLKADYLSMSDYIENRHFLYRRNLLGEVLSALFLQENRTKTYFHQVYADAIKLEKTPPHQWTDTPADLAEKYPSLRKGPLWWVQNPAGKLVADRTAIANLVSLIHKSYHTVVLTDLLRISAELHLRYDGSEPAGNLLETLPAFQRLDPFSGSHYRWNADREALFSFGPDLDNDGGEKEYYPDLDGDYRLPVKLHRKR
jgi:hypothetical protein